MTPEELINGNPVMWVWAAAFLAAVYAWPGPLVLMKPTLAPFALLGVRDRRWWAVLGLGLLAAVPFGGMWLDYASAARNVSAPVLYYIRDYPMLLMPAIAKASCRMLGSRSRSGYPRDMPRRDPVA